MDSISTLKQFMPVSDLSQPKNENFNMGKIYSFSNRVEMEEPAEYFSMSNKRSSNNSKISKERADSLLVPQQKGLTK